MLWHNHPMPTKPDTPTHAAAALSAALGYRRVIRPTSEQMLKAMAQAADEQRMVLVGAGTAATQKTRVGGLKRAAGVFVGQGNEE